MLFIFMLLTAVGVVADKADKADKEINWQVISSGGGPGSSTNFRLNGTIGQTAVGSGGSSSFGLNHGYWQDFGGEQPCDCEPGNCNGDGNINILDITYLINHLYKGGPAPVPYAFCSGDPNCNCVVNILDITYLINFLYKGGPAPCSCSDWLTACGPPLRK